ncbi:hypothetical protein ISF_07258 [Cordyceps fumosorosea ARSEF 2679]|uniref:T6SS Phospholipase effector Tle1-like catalytic domain-containing protein n=1 Tax=Cordyceps fumosorosea (strain ARSEF 2679) TaxID=1081104 RepID=A0A167Q6B0_CORFA|nr:hypothetical protein ISF_07258 [Cordyceps fumosorosea ARSEF 2679]OAA57337.1 hypothetical protein ISF_07258 [Cordyceps fumosorosea ARSEF 2679]
MNVPVDAPAPGQRKLVLCFDGTGNKFHGDDSDSNILKIFRMLDRSSQNQYHYYQPGIGTYVTSDSLSQSGTWGKISEQFQKAKDSAIGTSFDQHVVAGYRFLMRYYKNGDQIYMFGFSRGAYIARFLAEMLDYIGLLSHGNEEMIKFAWRAFSQWQCRRKSRSTNDADEDDGSDISEGETKTDKMYKFMKDFRETFSRPVGRIRFLGLFDTVNSVSRFESAWMQRAKFPYTARTSAEVIRHAVSIDERRAKFRQDLLYQKTHDDRQPHHLHLSQLLEPVRRSFEHYVGGGDTSRADDESVAAANLEPPPSSEREGGHLLSPADATGVPPKRTKSRNNRHLPYRMAPRTHSFKTRRRNGNTASAAPLAQGKRDKPDYEEDFGQDIDEVWFAGGHGDVGGGWPIVDDDRRSASHVPLTWIVREAMAAGLEFDMQRMQAMGCAEEQVHVTVRPPPPESMEGMTQVEEDEGVTQLEDCGGPETQSKFRSRHSPVFTEALHRSHTSRLHDSLDYGGGLGFVAVTAWRAMEWLPFRRMDLQSDGSWRPIRWPLPRGEVRDVPPGVRVHGSVLRRMQADEGYRPGNLIVGGGGRGVRIAPKELGIGEWQCVAEPGDPIGEIWTRKETR